MIWGFGDIEIDRILKSFWYIETTHTLFNRSIDITTFHSLQNPIVHPLLGVVFYRAL